MIDLSDFRIILALDVLESPVESPIQKNGQTDQSMRPFTSDISGKDQEL